MRWNLARRALTPRRTPAEVGSPALGRSSALFPGPRTASGAASPGPASRSAPVARLGGRFGSLPTNSPPPSRVFRRRSTIGSSSVWTTTDGPSTASAPAVATLGAAPARVPGSPESPGIPRNPPESPGITAGPDAGEFAVPRPEEKPVAHEARRRAPGFLERRLAGPTVSISVSISVPISVPIPLLLIPSSGPR